MSSLVLRDGCGIGRLGGVNGGGLSALVRDWLLAPAIDLLGDLMATAEELQTKVDALRTALTDAQARIVADVDELRRLLEERVDPDTLDAVSGALDQLVTDVQGIDPDPSFPPEGPVEPTP